MNDVSSDIKLIAVDQLKVLAKCSQEYLKSSDFQPQMCRQMFERVLETQVLFD